MMQMPSYLSVLKNNTKKILKILLISKNEHSKNFNFAVRAIHKMVKIAHQSTRKVIVQYTSI